MNKYYWSFDINKEGWYCGEESIEECIASARDEDETKKIVYIGKCQEYEADLGDIDIIERLQEIAYGQCGEVADGWLDGLSVKDIARLNNRLNIVFQDWLEEINECPQFGNFSEIFCYNIKTGEKREVLPELF